MSLKPLLKSHKALNAELSLLEALLYRSKNQYRGFPFWQKVVEVKRCSGKVADDIEALVGRLSKRDEKGKAKSSRQMILALEKVQSAANKAYFALRQIIQLESFMPLVLSLAAIVSKISSIAEELLAHIALAASAIDSLAADEPRKMSKDKSVNVSVNSSREVSRASSLQPVTTSAPLLPSVVPKSSREAIPEPMQSDTVSVPAEASLQKQDKVENQKRKAESEEVQPVKEEKKKKRKKDEIDDIFGNL